MGIWDAMEMLNKLVDESDPDVRLTPLVVSLPPIKHSTDIVALQTSVSQIEHLLQTAEAMRRDNKPDWMQVTGLVHDLGKLLFMFGSEGQWDVVGVSGTIHIASMCLGLNINIFDCLMGGTGYLRRRLWLLREDHIPRDVQG